VLASYGSHRTDFAFIYPAKNGKTRDAAKLRKLGRGQILFPRPGSIIDCISYCHLKHLSFKLMQTLCFVYPAKSTKEVEMVEMVGQIWEGVNMFL
jgi:hypothetical protein